MGTPYYMAPEQARGDIDAIGACTELGEEYIGTLTGTGLSSVAKVSPEQLREGVEVLAEMAGILRAVPRAHHPSVAARATVRD